VLWHVLDIENNPHHRNLLDMAVLYPGGAIASDAMPVDAVGRQRLHRRRLAAAEGRHLASAFGGLLHPLHPRVGAGAARKCRCWKASANAL
jgi:hypothetical protein